MKKPSTCPKCGSSNIWRTFVRTCDDDTINVYSVLCKNCYHTWLEHYKTELEKIEEPEVNPDEKIGVYLAMSRKTARILFSNLRYLAAIQHDKCDPATCDKCFGCLFYAKDGNKKICLRIPTLQAANLLSMEIDR